MNINGIVTSNLETNSYSDCQVISFSVDNENLKSILSQAGTYNVARLISDTDKILDCVSLNDIVKYLTRVYDQKEIERALDNEYKNYK